MEKIEKNFHGFKITQFLGAGTFGSVYLAYTIYS